MQKPDWKTTWMRMIPKYWSYISPLSLSGVGSGSSQVHPVERHDDDLLAGAGCLP